MEKLERKYDFFAVQQVVDSYWHDITTLAIFKTYDEAKQYVRDESLDIQDISIVPQNWGEYVEEWD